MKPEEDIGSLIKSKLQSAQKASKESTWERIQYSLEERRKKRRIAFYYKVGSAGLLILLGALFMFNYVNMDTKKSTTVSQKEMHLKSDSQKTLVHTEKSNDIPETSTSIESETKGVNNIDTRSTSHLETPKKSHTTIISKEFNETLKNNQVIHQTKAQIEPVATNDNTSLLNSTTATKKEKAVDTMINRNDVPVTQTTQKVYYYYNSKNGQEVSSTDKRVIDSIVEINKKKQDTLKTHN